MPKLKQQEEQQMRQHRLLEGLRAKDLAGFVEPTFTIDQYTSKMGEDQNVIVLGFRVNDKNPATDLMEFIEKGYPFVLDADMSSGEERDGKYQVFVEIERSKRLPEQIKELLGGISRLVDNKDWRFRYHKNFKSAEFSEQAILENVPLTKEDYKAKMLEVKNDTVREFFNRTPVDLIQIDEENTITIAKPYSGYINMELMAMGDYDEIKDSLLGAIQLDEASQSQVTFLEKYLGPYEIHKINNKFLIINGTTAMIVSKERW
jgi:hypothetical protein